MTASTAGQIVSARPSTPHCHYHVPGTSVALLTYPAKIPCPSWSLPAGRACPFAFRSDPDAICGSCYAAKGFYMMPRVKAAQDARYAWTLDCLKTPEGTERFIALMTEAIAHECARFNVQYFRVHDSGDLFSPAYTRAWTEICRRLPDIRFWIPTRSYRAAWVADIIALAALPNVTVRPSALRFEDAAPEIAGLQAGSTARHHGATCPASSQGNACLDCRQCWDSPTIAIAYHKH
jgi:hypothetical protein